jgi:branched-chain amino acid transport system ATP-binding protein
MSLLTLSKLTKRFGHFTAVSSVDLEISEGERHAVIGSNGAGKSSLFHLISGRLKPTSGSVRFRDREIGGLQPHQVVRMGLARSFQITNIFPHLSVLENLRLSVQARRSHLSIFGRSIILETTERATQLLKLLQLSAVGNVAAETLSYGDQRRLEIGIALALDPILLLLDEPTAGMSLSASKEIVELLHQIPRKVSILLIEHDVDVVLKLADNVTVMHHGEVIARGTPNEVQNDLRVQDAYFGGPLEASGTAE